MSKTKRNPRSLAYWTDLAAKEMQAVAPGKVPKKIIHHKDRRASVREISSELKEVV